MSDSTRFEAIADQMLRLATAALTEAERNSYVELARNWRKLAEAARAWDAKHRPQIDGVVIPMPEDRPDTEAS